MASTLDGGHNRDRITTKGHGTSALGPSDTSDSASDIAGAGADIGDRDLASDSDSVGTGEHRTAGRDPRVLRDIGPDRVGRLTEDGAIDDESAGADGDEGLKTL